MPNTQPQMGRASHGRRAPLLELTDLCMQLVPADGVVL